MSQNGLIQLILTALGAWMGIQLVGKLLGPLGILLLTLCAGMVALTIYMLQYERPRLAKAYRQPVLRMGIDLICKWLNKQPPLDNEVPADRESGRQLREPEDFDWAVGKLKEAIFGLDPVIDAVVGDLKKSVILRGRSVGGLHHPPLGLFLLAGPEGVGKRHFAMQLTTLLYRTGGATVVDLAGYHDDSAAVGALFGTPAQGGVLLQPVKSRPYHVIVLENVHAAGPAVLARLQQVLESGICQDAKAGGVVDFQHCVFFLTTSAVPQGAAPEKLADLSKEERSQKLIELFARGTSLNASLLALMHEILTLKVPAPLDKARILLRLMQEECAKFQVNLAYVEPEIVADEVAAFQDSLGFAWSRSRMAARLRESLVMASEHKLANLVLTREQYFERP